MNQWLKALLITVAIPLLAIAVMLAWQSLRWTFASPLALAFEEQTIEGSVTASFSHAEVRKFIQLDVKAADDLATAAGFDCKALVTAPSNAVCYRDIIEGLCKQLWRIQLFIGKNNKITRSSASIRQTCWR